MKDQVQEKAVEILSQIQGTIKKAGDFSMEQLPDIAMQYVLYGRIQTLVDSILFLFFSLLCFLICRFFYKRVNKSVDFAILSLISFVMGFVFFLSSIASINLMVWIAPKAWLLKELAQLVK